MEKRVQLLGPAVALNNITPCAACKLLRRRCAEECPFSPYFSPHEPHRFLAVHKVFGASNVSKLLMEVPENQRADAANSLVYEANVRIRDPVYGCMGAIAALQQQLHSLQAQLEAVRAEILKHDIMRSQAASTPTITSNNSTITGAAASSNNISIPTAATTRRQSDHHLMRSSSGTLSAVAMLPPSSSSDLPQRPLTPPLHPASAPSASSNSTSSSTTSTAVTISSLYSTPPNNSNSISFRTNNNGYMCFD
ncbi:unnamed protein product [Rhodiola kirilowii]